jgi:hypothetical protein
LHGCRAITFICGIIFVCRVDVDKEKVPRKFF